MEQKEHEILNSAMCSTQYRSASLITKLFNNWKDFINSDIDNINDNPNKYFANKDAEALIAYCKGHENESLIYLADKIFAKEHDINIDVLSLLFCNIMYDKYGYKIEDIKNEWKNNPYTEDGAYIFPSAEYFTKLYIKEIIKEQYKTDKSTSKLKESVDIGNIIAFSENPIKSNDFDIDINIPSDTEMSLQIIDTQSGKATNIINNQFYKKGTERIHIDTSTLAKGMHVCILKIGNQKIVRKLVKK